MVAQLATLDKSQPVTYIAAMEDSGGRNPRFLAGSSGHICDSYRRSVVFRGTGLGRKKAAGLSYEEADYSFVTVALALILTLSILGACCVAWNSIVEDAKHEAASAERIP